MSETGIYVIIRRDSAPVEYYNRATGEWQPAPYNDDCLYDNLDDLEADIKPSGVGAVIRYAPIRPPDRGGSNA